MPRSYQLAIPEQLQQKTPLLVLLLMSISGLAMIEPSPFDLFSLMFLIVLAITGLKIPRRIGIPLLLAVAFLIANLLSFYEVSDFFKAFRYLAISTYMFVIWLLFTALFYYDAEQMLKAFWKGYLIAASLSALIGTLAFFHLLPDSELFLKHERAKALFKDPNVYGPFLVPVILYCGATIFSNISKLRKSLHVAILLLLLIGLLVGFSRAAWGNFLFATLLFLLLKLLFHRSLKLFIHYIILGGLATGLFIVTVTALLQVKPVADMMTKRASLVQSYDVGETGRFGTQYRALMLGLQKPVGVGAGEVRQEFARYPHNVYLLTLVENGWLGMISFSAFMFLQLVIATRFFRRIARGHEEETPPVNELLIIYSVLLTTVLQSLFIDTLHWRHMFILFGVLLGTVFWSDRNPALARYTPISENR